MKLQINERAATWYEEELEMDANSCLRFFVRYGGAGNVPGFSLAIKQDEPHQPHASVQVNGITYYVEESDAWYFEDKDLIVNFNEKLNEPVFIYEKIS